jgi:hypothetical protein
MSNWNRNALLLLSFFYKSYHENNQRVMHGSLKKIEIIPWFWCHSFSLHLKSCGLSGRFRHDANKAPKVRLQSSLCTCLHNNAFGEALNGLSRCGPPFLAVLVRFPFPNLGPKSLFPISGLCSTDKCAVQKSVQWLTHSQVQYLLPLASQCC